MFTVVQRSEVRNPRASEAHAGDSRRAMIDESRDAWFVFASGLPQSGSEYGMILGWGDRLIPLEIEAYEVDNKTGHFYRSDFITFGESAFLAFKLNTPSYVFASADERRSSQILTVEALLAYGSHYDGLTKPDGYYRVAFEEKLWILSDFGYEQGNFS